MTAETARSPDTSPQAPSATSKVAVFLPAHGDTIEAVFADEEFMRAQQGPESGASWAWKHQRPTGAGMDLHNLTMIVLEVK